MELDVLKKRKQSIILFSVVIMLFTFCIASFAQDPNCLTPTDAQYLELRAVSVRDVKDQNKQVIMELWGNNLEFKRI